MLRVADALDRTHFGVVKTLTISRSGGRVVLRVDAGLESAELELWATERRIDLLSRLLGCPIGLRAVATRRAPTRRGPRRELSRRAARSHAGTRTRDG